MKDLCTIWAYDDIKKTGYISDRQAMYLSVFSEAYPDGLTKREASEIVVERFKVGFSKCGFGSRISELENLGFLEKDGYALDPITKKKVNVWRYTQRKDPIILIEVCAECPHCNGRGKIKKFVPQKNGVNYELW